MWFLTPLASLAVLALASRNDPPTLEISRATLTSKWIESSDYVQIIEMIISNSNARNSLTLADTLNVTVSSDLLQLVNPGTLTRLAPGQSAVVQVGVQNKANVAAGTHCTATVIATYGQEYGPTMTANKTITGSCGISDYTASSTSLAFHQNPDWFNNVKFGIFIHWGLYSAPAYGNTGANEDYAEWYWFHQHDPTSKTQTYQYHEETYGTNFTYDQFISNFTAESFDAKTWVDLIANAGARYMVPVTKHHDGFSLFNFSTSISKRSSVWYGPKRDFIGELFAAAKQYHPSIRRGTYYSLPEWYNPAYIPYGGGYFGAALYNPYTNESEPYTGYVNISDYVLDLQLPHMETLAYDYDTDLMWCDIGGANNSTIFASQWINTARKENRQVTFNNRCGIQGDFDTPEYTTNSGTLVRKWESNRGMDPYSFGFNYQTPNSAYLTSRDIVTSLVDIVSKNGNFLLDIGPEHNGSIPAIMSQNLLDAGSWIIPHSEGIFDTRYWSVTPGLALFRYTTTSDSFYIHYMGTPPSSLVVPDPVPYLPGDKITVLGGSQHGKTVDVSHAANGSLTLNLTPAIIGGDQYVWSFKLAYTSTW